MQSGFDKKNLLYTFSKRKGKYDIKIYECVNTSFCIEEHVTKNNKIEDVSLFIKKDIDKLITYIKGKGYTLI